jgi:polyferredoxin
MNSSSTATAASLIEPGVKSFLKLSLQNCRQFKERHYNTIFNVCVFIGFVAVVGTILFVKYKTRPNPDEVERRRQEQREYVLSQLKLVNAKNYLAAKNASYQSLGSGVPASLSANAASSSSHMITGLPEWNVGAATSGHYQMFIEDQQERRNDEEYYLRMKNQ